MLDLSGEIKISGIQPSLRAALFVLFCRMRTEIDRRQEESMLQYALVFLILGLVASALGAYGVAAVASQIAWVLFVIGVVLLVVHLISGRRTLVP